MNRLYMKARTMFLNTSLGKRIRYKMQMNQYKETGAMKLVCEAYPDMDESEKSRIVSDMMTEAKKYNVGFDEYIMYHFKDREFEDRRKFIPTRERALYCERLNNPKNQMVFDDKGETYKVFKKYFHRDLIEVVHWTNDITEEFKKFAEKHSRFIVKPFNGGNGRGIQIYDKNDFETFEKLCKMLKTFYRNGFVAEELIIQAKELSAVHASSVNTMRIFTILFDDRVEFLPCAWRVGRGKSCVDNGGSGGIFCVLDDNGVIIKTCDEKGRTYDVHPDTQHPLVGFKIPRFEEAKALAAELAKVVPGNRYCGWDLALTENGWIMQEGNWQGGVVTFQCPMQSGCRDMMDKIMNELKL